MSRYVNIEPYEECKIVLHKEDEGIRCRDLPTADVAEVRHGEWLKHYRSGTTVSDGYVSSCCDMWNERKSQYCPHCGAKMNEERKDEK